ncbi:MAG: AraC family transcriptional regulator [Spirochaetia bacterium]|nr:AraC family transcriptional regulator [Spirochaetia bacterium]
MRASLLERAEIAVLFHGKWSGDKTWGFQNRELEAWQLYAVLSGRARFEVKGETVRARAGDAVLLAPHSPYFACIEGRENFVHLSLHFTCQVSGGIDLMPALGLSMHQKRVSGEWIRLLENDFALAGKKPLDGRTAALLRWFLLSRAPLTDAKRGLDPRIVLMLRFHEVVTSEISESVDLPRLAEKLGVSPRRLAKETHLHSGLRPIELVRKIKIEKAKELLRSGLSATETADRTGFADLFYFSRVFRQVAGLSPTAYLRASELARAEKSKQ